MRISDWSSDVCPSDLPSPCAQPPPRREHQQRQHHGREPPPARRRRPPWRRRRLVDVAQRQFLHRHQAALGPAKDGSHDSLGASLDSTCTRSEEHTSELQSLMRISYAVFCLKKKKHNKPSNND